MFLFGWAIEPASVYSLEGPFERPGPGIYKNGKKIEGFRGRRSKEEIELMLQLKEELEEAKEEPIKEELKGKYAVQKNFAYSVHAVQKIVKKVGRKQREGLDVSSEITKLLAQNLRVSE